MQEKKLDVAVMGGGLAGNLFARQLKMQKPELEIAIFERDVERGYKVGESTVEIAANYLIRKQKLSRYLYMNQLPKNSLRFFFMDEARFGQQGTLTRIWAPRGSRPTAVKQTRYEWVYLYAAVEPATGASVALQAPSVDTGTMSVFLELLAREIAEDEHAVVIMDQAGWHVSRALEVPEPSEGAEEPEPPFALAVSRGGLALRFSLRPHRDPSTRAGRKYARLNEGDEVLFVASLPEDSSETRVLVASTDGHGRYS